MLLLLSSLLAAFPTLMYSQIVSSLRETCFHGGGFVCFQESGSGVSRAWQRGVHQTAAPQLPAQRLPEDLSRWQASQRRYKHSISMPMLPEDILRLVTWKLML